MASKLNIGLAGLVVAAAVFCTTAQAAPIVPVSASGTGVFNNSPSLIIDGVVPAESSNYNAGTNVHWSGTTPQFTIDLGALYQVQDLLVSVDNNDSYRIDYSTDNVSYVTLIAILSGYGEISFGMDTFSTVSGDPEYVAALDFSPVNARYLRIQATGGDNFYSIGELQAFGDAIGVPEPAVLALFGLGLAGIGAARGRRR